MWDWLLLREQADHVGLKPARSKAELIRTRNSNILLFIGISQFCVNACVALKVFGVL